MISAHFGSAAIGRRSFHENCFLFLRKNFRNVLFVQRKVMIYLIKDWLIVVIELDWLFLASDLVNDCYHFI